MAAVQLTFTHKQYTEYKERNIITITKLNMNNNKILTNLCPVFASYTLAFALQLRKKHGKTSVRVAARTTQADTVQYKNTDNNTISKKTITGK